MPATTEDVVEVVSDPIREMIQLTVLANPYIPIIPTIPQARFLCSTEDEVMYGGAAGGGKSIALLAAALQFAMMPQYDALILRRSFPDLNQPRALIPLSFEWLSDTDAEWSDREHRWYFPSGATLTFGHMNTEKDRFDYQGSAFNFIGFDELTQFKQIMYTYLFSRLRRGHGVNIPGRMRAGSNPGGEGHEWVKSRFLTVEPNTTATIKDEETGEESTRVFIPARLEENPYLDQADYKRKLAMLDPVTKAQLLRGDWDILPEGNLFKRNWFRIIDRLPNDIMASVRAWDLASTPVSETNTDPDWTSGNYMSRTARNTVLVHDARHLRGAPAQVQALVLECARSDGRGVPIRIEQEPGASGKIVIYNYANQLLPGYDVMGIPPTGSKLVRAGPLSAAAFRGDVEIMRGAWNGWWLDNVVIFSGDDKQHDDAVDSAAHAYNHLMENVTIQIPSGPIGGYDR